MSLSHDQTRRRLALAEIRLLEANLALIKACEELDAYSAELKVLKVKLDKLDKDLLKLK